MRSNIQENAKSATQAGQLGIEVPNAFNQVEQLQYEISRLKLEIESLEREALTLYRRLSDKY